MDFLEGVVARCMSSYAVAAERMMERKAAGVQPPMWYTDVTSLVTLNTAYLLITFLLYRFMSSRKEGFNLKWLLVVYNAMCVLFAGFCAVEVLLYKFKYPGSFYGNNDNLVGPDNQRMAFAFWFFYAQKFFEYFDTWFFILKKNFRQVTFLHVYHHSSITFVVGLIVPYSFSGDFYLPILLNSLVHVVMYSYYLLMVLKVPFPWKSMITIMQLVQFCLIMAQNILNWRAGVNVGEPDFGKVAMIVYMSTMIILFSNFFIRSYLTPKDKAAKGKPVKEE